MLRKIQERNRLAMTCPATLPCVDAIVAESVGYLESVKAACSLFDLKLLLREALINAVVHGSALDASKTVSCELALADGLLRMIVSDEGPGFDWSNQMAREPALDATSGRGLLILRLYADDVSFNAKGNVVTLEKRLNVQIEESVPGAPDAALDQPPNPRETHMFELRKEDGRSVIRPGVDIVASIIESLKAQIQQVLAENPGPLTIDLDGASMVDSMGIGLLIAAHNSLSKSGERLKLINVSADILTLFRTMRLDKHFAIEA